MISSEEPPPEHIREFFLEAARLRYEGVAASVSVYDKDHKPLASMEPARRGLFSQVEFNGLHNLLKNHKPSIAFVFRDVGDGPTGMRVQRKAAIRINGTAYGVSLNRDGTFRHWVKPDLRDASLLSKLF